MEKLTIEITKNELLIIISGLVTAQVVKGVKDDGLADLLVNLSQQAIDSISKEEMQKLINNI